jgi:hypothetical protein
MGPFRRGRLAARNRWLAASSVVGATPTALQKRAMTPDVVQLY